MNDQSIRMYEAMSHLGAALAQSIDSDDPVIMQHVRDAYVLLGGKLEWLSSQRTKDASESAKEHLHEKLEGGQHGRP